MSDEYSNLPPGTFDGDPRAPWNEGDGDRPEGDRWCGNCGFFCTVLRENASRNDVLCHACARGAEYGDLYEVMDDTEPCALWVEM